MVDAIILCFLVAILAAPVSAIIAYNVR